MRTVLFILLTWGVILGLPVLAFLGVRGEFPRSGWVVPGLVSLALLCLGVLSGEWLARLANGLIGRVWPLSPTPHC